MQVGGSWLANMESSQPGNVRTDTVIVSKNRYVAEMGDGASSVLTNEACSSRAADLEQCRLSLPDNEDNRGNSETVEHELTYGKFFLKSI